MTKILLTGHGGSNNRGCEAIIRCTIDIINRYLGPTEITIMSFDPASDRSSLLPELGDVHIPDVQIPKPRKYSFRWIPEVLERRVIRRVWLGIPSYFSFVNRSIYHDKDVVISIGGDNFCYEDPSHFFGELALARSNGSLTVIWGATFGQFHNKSLEKRWANRLRKIDLITVRDTMSLKYLKSIDVIENVRHVADPAFLLPMQEVGAFSLSSFKSNIIIGIGMSAFITKYSSGYNDYIDSFSTFVKAILSDKKIRVLLVPHVIQKGTTNNDEMVCQHLADKLSEDDRIMLMDCNYNASQIKHTISQSDYFIGARTHSTIASMSSFVPTICIGYSPKAYGINEDIFGHIDYVLPISDLNGKSLVKKYDLLCNNYGDIVKQLHRQIPKIKHRADQGGIYLREILCDLNHHSSPQTQ